MCLKSRRWRRSWRAHSRPGYGPDSRVGDRTRPPTIGTCCSRRGLVTREEGAFPPSLGQQLLEIGPRNHGQELAKAPLACGIPDVSHSEIADAVLDIADVRSQVWP